MTNCILCPLCESGERSVFWRREFYPAIGGKVVSPDKAKSVPWLSLEIALCGDCGHIYQSQPPTADFLDSFYSGNYVSSNPSLALGGTPPRGLDQFLQLILKCTGSQRGHALEIGAYDGYFLHLLEKAGWQATGYEPSAIGDIGRRFFNVDIRREFYQPGSGGERWDLVASRYVFEHLASPRLMLKGIFADLQPGGWLALEVPDLKTRLREGVLGCFAHEHISYFVPETFRRLVGEAGFQVRELQNSRDGLVVLAQKPVTGQITKAAEKSSAHALTSRLVEEFEKKRTHQRARFATELSRWNGARRFIIYGGDSHTTDLLVERWLPPEEVIFIVDDDPAKQGQVAAGFEIPVRGRGELPEDALVVLSAFGHHDRLLENLADWRARGGAVMCFYPECKLVLPAKV